MSVDFIYKSGCICAKLYGEIDHHSAADIRIQTDAQIERLMPSILIFDFSGVQFMDSSGIGLILGRRRLMETMHGDVKVKNPPPNVRKIITLAGLADIILKSEAANSEKGEDKNALR